MNLTDNAKEINTTQRKHHRLLLTVMLVILFIIIILSFGVGYYPLTPSQVLKAFLSKFDDIIELFYQAAEEQVLEEKNIDVAYMEDDHAWARINDILDCLYPFGITDDKEKNDAIYDRAFAKLNASLMPIDDIKEGSLYVEPSSLEVVLTPDDNSKKISSKGKKSKR